MIILLLILLFFELVLIRKIIKFYLLSQVHLYLLFYLIAITISTLYYYFYEDKISLFDLDFIKNELFIKTLEFHLLGLIAFSFGVIIYYDLARKRVKLLFNKSFSQVLFFRYKLPGKINRILGILLVIILLLYGFTYGGKIFYRNVYLIDNSRALQTLTKLLSFIATVFLGMVYIRNKRLSISVFLVIMLLTIGTGSRISFLYLVVYVILVFQANGNTLRNKLILFVNLVVSFFFLSYVMTLRAQDMHGVFPYLSNLFSDQNKLFDSVAFNIYYSFIFGIFVSAKTITLNIPDWNNIIISLNPLTGNMAGWYEIAGKMRIYPIVPYSSNGEVFTMGGLFTFIFYTVVGSIVTYFDSKTRNFFSKGKRIHGFLIVILFVMYIVYSFEYNLRSSFRYIYYILALIIILSIKFKKIRFKYEN